jgi:error-prone DNA polymerase
VQLTLPLELPVPPQLRDLSGWEAMLADYETAGLTVSSHPIALLRERLPAGTIHSGQLEQLRNGSRVRIGGLVVARQRPGTAGGVVFILLEDEHGVINLIVPPKVYERHRLMVRTEPLLLVEGKLERFAKGGGAINVLVDQVGQISAPDRVLAQIKDFSLLDDQVRTALAAERAAAGAGSQASREADDFRAVAPPVMSFAAGRRR